MPTMPWMPVNRPADAGQPAVVMASHFKVRGFRHVLPFFIDALRVHRQVRRAEGAYGISLVARPVRREFWTLSAWRDQAALQAMVRTEPHRTVMKRHRPAMAESAFRFWTVPAGELPVTWDDALRRLEKDE